MAISDIQLLLASKSPRRRQLLTQLGVDVRFVDIDVEEVLNGGIPVNKVAEELALAKSRGYTAPLADDEILVTADTVVVHGDAIIGKPHSREEAVAMLRSLSGDRHTVYTGVSLRSATLSKSFTESTSVIFRPLSEDEIEHYVAQGTCMDKAGAYGIQEWIGMVGVERIEGCFYNVMGLPVSRLYAELKAFGH